jgi:hypothetical protein
MNSNLEEARNQSGDPIGGVGEVLADLWSGRANAIIRVYKDTSVDLENTLHNLMWIEKMRNPRKKNDTL